MKNVTLLEKQLQNATSISALVPVFSPDGESCIFHGNQSLLTVDTISALIADIFFTVHNNSQVSSITLRFRMGLSTKSLRMFC